MVSRRLLVGQHQIALGVAAQRGAARERHRRAGRRALQHAQLADRLRGARHAADSGEARLLRGHVLEHGDAELDAVARLGPVAARDAPAVDERAVGRAEVLDDRVAVFERDAEVAA